MVGTSRKSFIGRLLGDAPVDQRLHGTMATVTAAVLRGAHIVRVHDVKAAVETVTVADAIKRAVLSEPPAVAGGLTPDRRKSDNWPRENPEA